MRGDSRPWIRALAVAFSLTAQSGYGAVVFVDAGRKSYSNAPTGSEADPFATISAGVAVLRPGDSLSVRGGVYRETVDFSKNASLAIRREPGRRPVIVERVGEAPVWVKGSDVIDGWTSVAGDVYVKRPWTQEVQQVFVRGEQLRQVGGRILGGFPGDMKHPLSGLHRSEGGIWPGRTEGSVSDLAKGSFYFDKEREALWIRTESGPPGVGDVEVSVRPFLLRAEGVSDLVVRGLSFEHSNTSSYVRAGSVKLSGRRIVAEGLFVRRCDLIGIQVDGEDNEVRDSRVRECGQLGMHVRGRRISLLRNETSFNNTRGFNTWWEAGGVKLVGEGGVRDSVIESHTAVGNRGDGIWFDWDNENNRILRSLVVFNSGFGIHYEAGRSALILGNLAYGNELRGIYLPHSSDCIVANNLAVWNGMDGIVVVDEGRRDPSGKLDLSPRGNMILLNIVGWNKRYDLVVPRGAGVNVSDDNVFLAATPNALPAFSQGWPRSDVFVDRGLRQWQRSSGQDGRSVEVILRAGDDLRQASAQNVGISWETLKRTTRNLSFSIDFDRYAGAFSRYGLRSLPSTRPGPFDLGYPSEQLH